MAIKFGTDGWRAVISDEFTFANVRKVAQAIAEVTLETWHAGPSGDDAARPILVVGYDTRFLSDRYATTVAEVLAANGVHVLLSQTDAPTPMISFAIVDRNAAGGVMITASHNPPRYNGIKLKASYGGSAAPADASLVELRLRELETAQRDPCRMPMAEALNAGLVQKIDPLPTYEAHLRQLVNFDLIRAAQMSVAVDAMYGAGRIHLRKLLEDAGCRVTELRGEMNPGFNGIHPEPIERHLQPLMDEMATGKHQLGLATDGDADRIGAVDRSGRFVDPHCIMALLLEYLVHERKLTGSVVKTVSTTQMLNRLAERYSLPIHETPVGFNYISELMLSEEVLIGGEESGGISVLGHIPEGDGLLIGLLLTEMVASHGRGLADLLAELMAASDIGPFRYARHDQPVEPFEKAELVRRLMSSLPAALSGQSLVSASDRDGVKYVLADGSWLLIRPSGTEPILRIYAESRSQAQVQELIRAGIVLAEAAIGPNEQTDVHFIG